MNNENVRLFVRRILKQLQEGDAAETAEKDAKRALLRLRKTQLDAANKNLADKKKEQSDAIASNDPDKRDAAKKNVEDAEAKKRDAAGNVIAAKNTSF